MIKIELFSLPGCSKCQESQLVLQKAVGNTGKKYSWRQVNILDEIDYAVELGVLTTPAIAINDKLVFTSLPTVEKFCLALSTFDMEGK